MERVATRLAQVGSLAELHELLSELAADPLSRWTRTQVLHYLPAEHHRASREYFDGEQLRPPREQPPAPVPVDRIGLAAALARIAELPPVDDEAADTGAEPRGRPRSAAELSALPIENGADPVTGMLAALREEIRVVEQRAPRRFRLGQGRCVEARDGRFVYQFTWSSEPDLHAPGALEVGKRWVEARVGEQVPDAERRFEVLVEEYLGPEIANAVFRVDPTFLLRSVHDLLEAHHGSGAAVATWASRLLQGPIEVAAATLPTEITTGLNARQRRAVAVAAVAEVAYTWGPPGTGKTTSIAGLVRALRARGKRVLILSPYNVAVDQAVLSAARSGDASDGQVVRVGRIGPDVRTSGLDVGSQLERIAAGNGTLDGARALLAEVADRHGRGDYVPPATVRACLDELGAVLIRARASARDPMTTEVNRALATLRKRFRSPEAGIVRRAQVVGSTLSLYFISPLLQRQRFDHLVIDEASVLRCPEAVLALVQAGTPVTFFGDPKQLPAIVQSDSELGRRWLARSPFALAGVRVPADARGSCVFLSEQHRMAPPIRTLVSDLFYEGELVDGAHAPREGAVLVVDTSLTGARSTTKMVRLSHSRQNTVHRFVVAEVIRAQLAAEPGSRILVLSPFTAQKRLYRTEAATGRLSREVRYETIHTSQGSERDVVIVDLVLAGGGRRGRSQMLDGAMNPHLANLLNVALSRARRRLIFVADCEHLQREYHGGLVAEVLARARGIGYHVVVPRDLRCRTVMESALDGTLQAPRHHSPSAAVSP
jgi:hypothetical protein